MFKFQKNKCTEAVVGKIIKARWDGELWFITAEYRVNGHMYRKTEQLTYKIVDVKKIGSVPVRMQSTYALSNISEDAPINILFNPSKPKQSYFPDNNGKHLA